MFPLGNTNEMLISIIIPCYNSEKTIGRLVEMTIDEFTRLDGYECEFVLVNDHSADGTYNEICKLAEKHKCVKGISLARNFGQHNAMMAALNHTTGDLIMGMDDDMQTHPSQIYKFLDKLNEGYDIVFGKYPEKKHSRFRNWGSKFNDFTVRKLIGKPKGLTACSFWICRRFVRDEIIRYHNFNAHIQGLFLRTTGSITNVNIEHFEREVGKSNYTLKKLITHWAGCLNFSIAPLRFSTLIGAVAAVLGALAMVVVVIRKLINPAIAAGWSSVICLLLLFFGLILVSLGIIGEYIGRILLCINNTPQFVIRESINLEKDDSDEH